MFLSLTADIEYFGRTLFGVTADCLIYYNVFVLPPFQFKRFWRLPDDLNIDQSVFL